MGKLVNITADNSAETLAAIKGNEVSEVTVDVRNWLSHYSSMQRVDCLTTLADSFQNNHSVTRLKMVNFDFKQSTGSDLVEPEIMAKTLGSIANGCKNLSMVNLERCNLTGCGDLLKREIFDNFTDNRELRIFCKDIAYVAQPTKDGPAIFGSEPRSMAVTDFFKERHSAALSKELVEKSDVPTPDEGPAR